MTSLLMAYDALSIALDSSSDEMLPSNASILLSLSLSLMDLEPFKLERPVGRLLLLINGAGRPETNNASSDSLLTFVPSDADKTVLLGEEPGLPKSSKTLKLLMRLAPRLARCNLMPLLLRKKSVSFPLDGLEDVVFFHKHDTPLSVSAAPLSDEDGAFDALDSTDLESAWRDAGVTHTAPGSFGAWFDAPAQPTFWRVAALNLEQLVVSQKRFYSESDAQVVATSSTAQLRHVSAKRLLVGSVLVKNIAFEKHVCVRYTANLWRLFGEARAEYVRSLENGIDKFHFEIDLDLLVPDAQRAELEFCIRYQAGSTCYWDNNNGHNYKMHMTRHVSRRHRKQVSESNVTQFNRTRMFPEDHIDVWFKKGPSNNFTRDFPAPEVELGQSTFSGTSHDELVANYCFFGKEGKCT